MPPTTPRRSASSPCCTKGRSGWWPADCSSPRSASFWQEPPRRNSRSARKGVMSGEVRFAAKVVLVLALGLATTASAQPSTRLATTPEALVAAAVFFHGKQIAVRRDVEPAGELRSTYGTTHT